MKTDFSFGAPQLSRNQKPRERRRRERKFCAFRTSKIRKIHGIFTIRWYHQILSPKVFKHSQSLSSETKVLKRWCFIWHTNSTKHHCERRRRERKIGHFWPRNLVKYTVYLHFTFRWCNKYFQPNFYALGRTSVETCEKEIFISHAPANKNKTHRERRRRERKFGHFWGPKFVKYTVNSQATFRWSHQIVSPSFQAP